MHQRTCPILTQIFKSSRKARLVLCFSSTYSKAAQWRFYYVCWREDLNSTSSVPVVDILVRYAPKLSHNSFKSSAQKQNTTSKSWRYFILCWREDLNLHALRHTHLKRTWLPITPLQQYFDLTLNHRQT